MSLDYYDRQGRPITARQFAETHSAQMRVALTKVGAYEVSTVWLGIDHNHWGGRPILFETMVFAEGSTMDHHCDRYHTEAEAIAGHENVVGMVRALSEV
jgi:hypothetical protein